MALAGIPTYQQPSGHHGVHDRFLDASRMDTKGSCHGKRSRAKFGISTVPKVRSRACPRPSLPSGPAATRDARDCRKAGMDPRTAALRWGYLTILLKYRKMLSSMRVIQRGPVLAWCNAEHVGLSGRISWVRIQSLRPMAKPTRTRRDLCFGNLFVHLWHDILPHH